MLIRPPIFTFALALALFGWGHLAPDTPIACDSCQEWNEPHKPFQVFGNTYYVGTAGLSAVLVTSKEGLVLLDGDLPQSVPQIEANIRSLGFRLEDVRWVLNSHAHFDHAGGIAALARDTGARVGASLEGAKALRAGIPPKQDPQAGFGKAMRFAPVPRAEGLRDGEQVTVGKLVITAHDTPGHTPGATTWTWRSCEGAHCLEVVYADSLNPVSAPGFRFTGPGAPEGLEPRFRKSIATLAALPCDVLLSVHPGFSGTFEKLARREKDGETNPFLDPDACRSYAAAAARRLDERVAEENGKAGESR